MVKRAGMGALMLAVVVVLAFAVGCTSGSVPASQSNSSLTVAIYPYMPNAEHFKQSLQAEWAHRHPDVALDFVEWNCYKQDLPEDIDVFVYDSVYFGTLANQGLLLPLGRDDISDRGDIAPFALEACEMGGTTYAIPQLLCAQLLFTRNGDEALEGVRNVHELRAAIGDHTFQEVISGENVGLLTERFDGVGKACCCMQAAIDSGQNYRESFESPSENGIAPNGARCIAELSAMGAAMSPEDKAGGDSDHPHAELFSKDAGRAYVGYSEAMNDMGDYAQKIDFRALSLAEGENVDVLYADFASVSARVDEGKRNLAIEFLNLLTSSDMLVAASQPSEGQTAPQYLLLPRLSAYDILERDYPLYAKLKDLVTVPDAHVFRILPDGKRTIGQYEAALERADVSE